MDGYNAFRPLSRLIPAAIPSPIHMVLDLKKMIATETLEVQLLPLVIKIKDRCRPNYDDGLERALQMAGRAGVNMELEGLWQELADGKVQIDENREVFPLDPMARLRLEMLQKEADRADDLFYGVGKMDGFGDDLDEDDDKDQDDQVGD